MSSTIESLQVTLAPGGFLPQAFRWAGRFYRIVAVHSVKTCGPERRYRVATSEGYFELALHLVHQTWRVRRRPNWLSRVWYRWQNGARYPLPIWRRRGFAVRPLVTNRAHLLAALAVVLTR